MPEEDLSQEVTRVQGSFSSTDGSSSGPRPHSPLEEGSRISSRYRVKELIGRGAFGAVYRAYDEVLGRTVALKTLLPSRADPVSSEGEARFLAEARTVARLDHPNIIQVYDAGVGSVGERDRVPWMTMRLVEGESLRDLVRDRGKLPPERVREILAATAGALDHAHRRGVIHRDVKPSNILVEHAEDGTRRIWLADFGIAKQLALESTSRERAIIGTPAFMSPEQIIGRKVDSRTDLFSLGCVGFELLTGRPAFTGEEFMSIAFKVVHTRPETERSDRDLGGAALARVIRRCMTKSAEDRYPSAAALLEALGREEGTGAGSVVRVPMARLREMISPVGGEAWDGRNVLEVAGMEKAYKRGKPVLDGLNLRVPTGSIFAFLGRNGSGKTTFIRTVMGIYRQDQGTVSVFGRDPRRAGPAVLGRIGYVPETMTAYDWMKTGDLLNFMRGLYPDWDEALCYKLLGDYKLPLDKRLRELSKGMRTEVGLVCALSHRPEFLVLDDPTLGVDAVILDQVFGTLQDISHREGTTIFISSHSLEEIESIATHLGFLREGKVALSDSLERVRLRTREVRAVFRDEVPDLSSIPGLGRVRITGRKMSGVVHDTSSSALERIRALGPESVEVRELSLKEIFVNLMS